jgi:hypothetical protein
MVISKMVLSRAMEEEEDGEGEGQEERFENEKGNRELT